MRAEETLHNRVWYRIVWHRMASRVRGLPIFASIILFLLVFTAVFADFLAPHDPTAGNLLDRLKPPVWEEGGSTEHLLGTDFQGRDVLSRLIFGARVSLLVGFLSVIVAGFLGVLAGILSGYFGGWVDQVIMRLTDAWLALPTVVLAIFLAVILSPGVHNIILILGLVFWARYARVIRGEVLRMKDRDFIRLARVAGASHRRIMLKHILPNVINTAMVLATLMLGVVIIAEASLSFLGVGVPPPQPAWGLMLSESRETLFTGRWWLTVFPGIAIVLVVFAANLFGEWLRIKLDPQLRQL